MPEQDLQIPAPMDKAVKVDESSIGWKSDAHKNFPGFKSLYKSFPEASWYVMLDDDTYVNMKNLDDHLSQFDPLMPYYIGSSTGFVSFTLKIGGM
jgi:hypothetical protein